MARTSDPSTIVLHGDDDSRTRKDGVAQGTVTPGQLVEVQGSTDTGADDARSLGAQSGAAVPVPVRVALEYSHTGRGIDDDYSADEHMEYRDLQSGEEAYVFLAAGESVAPDDLLVSDGNGDLRAAAGDGSEDAAAIMVPTETVDNSGGADPVRLRAEAI